MVEKRNPENFPFRLTELEPEDYLPLIRMALQEDLGGTGDLTSEAIFADEVAGARIVAKQEGVLAGLPVAVEVFRTLSREVEAKPGLEEGHRFARGQVILELEGPVLALLKAERTALNFLGRLSGIATLTAQFVHELEGTNCRLLDTRKTTPGWRKLEKYAVAMGGGWNHRMGLYDMVLIKDNHITAAGGIRPAVERVKRFLREKGQSVRIEVEVTDLKQLSEALQLDVQQIMLDNMDLETMRKAVEMAGGHVALEASGNVRLENVREIARTGVDFISVGALTHSAPVCDFSMKIAS
jgi:nicotinate-nucleotide pyrophosphorylase (carboxylating)